MKPKNSSLLGALALLNALCLTGCLTTVEENGPCGLSNLSGSLAFPVRAGLAFKDPVANKYVVWMWDLFDAGVGQENTTIAEDWGSYCTAITQAGFTSGERPPQRTLVLTLAPPIAGPHLGPAGSGAPAMSAAYYEQGDPGGIAASTSSFDVTTTDECVTGPLILSMSVDGGASPLTGTISVPWCGPHS